MLLTNHTADCFTFVEILVGIKVLAGLQLLKTKKVEVKTTVKYAITIPSQYSIYLDKTQIKYYS